jgi:hypothetical protein
MKKFQDQELYDIFYQIAESKQLDKETLKSITGIVKQLKRLDASDKPFLGQEITITHHLVRKRTGHKREWVSQQLKYPMQGNIMGKRTISNGHTEYVEDGIRAYIPEEYFDAYLVSTDLKTKPKLVKI